MSGHRSPVEPSEPYDAPDPLSAVTEITVAGTCTGHAKCMSWAAAMEPGSALEGSRSRDERTTRFRLSACSRSRRSRSSGEPIQSRTANRRLTAANTDVTRGTITITVYAVSLNTPSDSPTEAITISSAPLALSPAPKATAARCDWPASLAPMKEPANLATMATAITMTAHTIARPSPRSDRSTLSPAVAKNTGARKALVSDSMWWTTSCCWNRERLSTTPATKAPSTASMPSACVATPNTSMVITAMPSAPPRLGPSRRTLRRLASTARWPSVMASARKAARPSTVRSVPVTDTSPTVANPANTASITQPTTSLAMPAATVIWPKSRLIKPSSERILAITASADTDSAAATNSANTVRSAPPPTKSSGNSRPVTSPAASGTTRLNPVTRAAARPRRRISARSVSNPAVTSSRATPSQATANKAPEEISECGRNQSKPLGQTWPKTEGPSTTPAARWPITEGSPTLRIP